MSEYSMIVYYNYYATFLWIIGEELQLMEHFKIDKENSILAIALGTLPAVHKRAPPKQNKPRL